MTDSDRRDPLVAAAAAHWGPRIAHNGTDYLDFEQTVARIDTWDDWCSEWGSTATVYENLARRAEDAGHAVTAAASWRRAGLCWHWAKFLFVVDPRQQRAAHDRAVDCFARGAGGLRPPATPVRVPYLDTALAGYLRVPSIAGGTPPIVVMVPGLDSVKEELQATAEHLLARGLAVLAIDGPGQGESEYELAIEPAYERVATAVVDWCETEPTVDATRAGIFGVSLGGYYAARSIAHEPRLRAGVDLAGPYTFGEEWDSLPPMTRAAFTHRSRSSDEREARDAALRLTLGGAAAKITNPLLVVHGGRDRIVGLAHAERLAAEAPGAELLVYEDGNHGVTNRAFESRSAMADWLAMKLGAVAPAPAV
ncbi:MAG: alpha/beta hydrolase family protein [Acidimicrobiales bacterium]